MEPTTSTSTSTSTSATTTTTKPIIILPKAGIARVKSVMSGDTVILLGKSTGGPNVPPPEVIFTFESMTSPRLASKTTVTDEAGAFAAREWLRQLVVGKSVRFETRKQGASAGDRVYGWLFLEVPDKEPLPLAIECVRLGHATPKAIKYPTTTPGAAPNTGTDDSTTNGGNGATNGTSASEPAIIDENDYESKLLKAYKEAVDNKRGIHSGSGNAIVRTIKTAGEQFQILALVEACQKLTTNKRIKCIVEYIFDGSRLRCQVIDPQVPDYMYSIFTILLAGISCPRLGNPAADPPVPMEAYSTDAKQFSTTRLLQRELDISLLGTDKVGVTAVGTIHHPAGNIAVELLKNGLARMTDWSVRLMAAGDVPALRFAENTAKRNLVGIWKSYAPPKLTTASQMRGTVIEVLSGDTLLILLDNTTYVSDDKLFKLSLASIRAPRVGSTQIGRADEPYAIECKERLRSLCTGKVIEIDVHYERDIPIRPGENEKRSFGTVSLLPKIVDVAEVLVSEGLAVTQRHRDDDEKSSRYDELRTAEATAIAAKKGVHKGTEYKRGVINDLTDPKKAKAYSGSLTRAGTLKATVDYVFNGALFKLHIPSENCYIRFSPNYIRCPQPSPSVGSKQPSKSAEPFGNEAKVYARLHALQRTIEINCSTVTPSGIIVGNMYMLGTGKNRIDYTIELIGLGLATVDQRKIDYGEAPKSLIDAQERAQENKVGLWSLEQPASETKSRSINDNNNSSKFSSDSKPVKVQVSEIRSGSHIFYHIIDSTATNNNSLKVIDDSMNVFTQTNGTAGAPCDPKVGKVVAALFDDGTGKKWYRAKVVEKKGTSKVSVLFVDYGNIASVPISTHLRPLDIVLHTDRIPPAAIEGMLLGVVTRPLTTDEGVDAARYLNELCWGKELYVTTYAPDENGKMTISLSTTAADSSTSDSKTTATTINSTLISEGLARVSQPKIIQGITYKMNNSSSVTTLVSSLNDSQAIARKTRVGMWRYGDIGDDDPNEL